MLGLICGLYYVGCLTGLSVYAGSLTAGTFYFICEINKVGNNISEEYILTQAALKQRSGEENTQLRDDETKTQIGSDNRTAENSSVETNETRKTRYKYSQDYYKKLEEQLYYANSIYTSGIPVYDNPRLNRSLEEDQRKMSIFPFCLISKCRFCSVKGE
jgi:hypothetical protein